MNYKYENIISFLLNETLEIQNVKLHAEDELENYGMDSVKFIEFIVRLEEHFQTEIPADKLLFENFRTVSDIDSLLCEVLETENKDSAGADKQ